MGLLSSVAGGALSAVGGTALDIFKMREGERLRWKYQEKYLENVQTHDREMREDTQAHAVNLADTDRAWRSGERVGSQAFQAQQGLLAHKRGKDAATHQGLLAKGLARTQSTLRKREETHSDTLLKERMGIQNIHDWFMLHEGADRRDTQQRRGLVYDAVQRRFDREHDVKMSDKEFSQVIQRLVAEQGHDLEILAEQAKDRRKLAKLQGQIGRKSQRLDAKLGKEAVEHSAKVNWKYTKKQHKWLAENMAPPEQEQFQWWSPQEEKVLFGEFKSYLGIDDESITSVDELPPELYERFTAYLKARADRNGAVPGVATWKEVGDEMLEQRGQGRANTASSVLDQAFHALFLMDNIADAPAMMFNPEEMINVSQMTKIQIAKWNANAKYLRIKFGLPIQDEEFAAAWRERYGPSYADYLQQAEEPVTFGEWIKTRRKTGVGEQGPSQKFQTPPPHAIMLFELQPSEWAIQ